MSVIVMVSRTQAFGMPLSKVPTDESAGNAFPPSFDRAPVSMSAAATDRCFKDIDTDQSEQVVPAYDFGHVC